MRGDGRDTHGLKVLLRGLRLYCNLHCINYTCNSFNTLELTVCLAKVAKILGNGSVQEGKMETGQENVDIFDDISSSLLILSDGNRK